MSLFVLIGNMDVLCNIYNWHTNAINVCYVPNGIDPDAGPENVEGCIMFGIMLAAGKFIDPVGGMAC